MKVIKTADTALQGYKYCIQDRNGNIIAVLPTRESREREFAEIGIDTDSYIEILFVGH